MELTFEHESGTFGIRPVTYNDLHFLMNLRNHPENRKFLGNNNKVSIEDQKNWFYKLENVETKKYFIFQFRQLHSDKIYWFMTLTSFGYN